MSDESESESGNSAEDEAAAARRAVLEAGGEFVSSGRWVGAKPGYSFKRGEEGMGYYRDVPLHVRAEQAMRDQMKFTAAQLANWTLECLAEPPSLDKADRYFGLFNLDELRVCEMTNSARPPVLFDSLEDWFKSARKTLARRVPTTEVSVTLRLFLQPQQQLRQGLEHSTFTVDWMTVAGGEGEPLSDGILRRMGMAGRRPKRMLLVVMYRAERNQIRQVWVQVDREGLGAKEDAEMDDVLVSDVFDSCLDIARRAGAIGELQPLFFNYFQAPLISF